MDPYTRDIGTTISKTGSARKSGQTVHLTKVSIKEVSSMVKEHLLGLMEVITQGCLSITSSRGRVLIVGATEESFKESGRKIKWKEREFSNGLMDESILENTKMT